MCPLSSKTVNPSTPGAPLFAYTFSYAVHRLLSEVTFSIKLIPSCFFISMRHPYTLLYILPFPTYLSIGSHLSGKCHDDFLCFGGRCLHLLVLQDLRLFSPSFPLKLLWRLLTPHNSLHYH